MEYIRFRVWDNNLEEYFLWDDSVKFNSYHDLVEDGFTDAVVLEQYTGVSDANNVSIYMNDIVKLYDECYNSFGDPVTISKTGVIIFHSGAFWIKTTTGDEPLHAFYENTLVIGNIHQNGDLIEEN